MIKHGNDCKEPIPPRGCSRTDDKTPRSLAGQLDGSPARARNDCTHLGTHNSFHNHCSYMYRTASRSLRGLAHRETRITTQITSNQRRAAWRKCSRTQRLQTKAFAIQQLRSICCAYHLRCTERGQCKPAQPTARLSFCLMGCP